MVAMCRPSGAYFFVSFHMATNQAVGYVLSPLAGLGKTARVSFCVTNSSLRLPPDLASRDPWKKLKFSISP
jgi:hypothetical protein